MLIWSIFFGFTKSTVSCGVFYFYKKEKKRIFVPNAFARYNLANAELQVALRDTCNNCTDVRTRTLAGTCGTITEKDKSMNDVINITDKKNPDKTIVGEEKVNSYYEYIDSFNKGKKGTLYDNPKMGEAEKKTPDCINECVKKD